MPAGLEALGQTGQETDGNTYNRRSKTYDAVPLLLRSTFVGCGNFEGTGGLGTDSPIGDVNAHNLATSWFASRDPPSWHSGRRDAGRDGASGQNSHWVEFKNTEQAQGSCLNLVSHTARAFKRRQGRRDGNHDCGGFVLRGPPQGDVAEQFIPDRFPVGQGWA